MTGTKLFVCNIIVWLATPSKCFTRAEERLNNSLTRLNETQALNVFPGVKFFSTDGREIVVRVRMSDLLQGIRCILFTLAP